MLLSHKGIQPKLGEGVFIAPTALVVGDVQIGDGSSVWFGAVVRGDMHWIRIGRETNIQDLCVLHVTTGRHPLTVGSEVTVGHRVVLHGCTVGDRVLVGMGSVLLDGCVIGDESIVAAGSLVPEGAVFPPRSVLMGAPAKRVREATDADIARILEGRDNYRHTAAVFLSELGPPR